MQAYFWNSLATTTKKIADNTAYITGVPVPHFNGLTLDGTDYDLTTFVYILKESETFFDNNRIPFSVFLRKDYVTEKMAHVLKALNYSAQDQEEGLAMVLSLENFTASEDLHPVCDIRVENTSNNLESWMIPLVGAFESTYELTSLYKKAHERALVKQADFYHFTLYVKERPVTSATLSVHNTLGIINDVGTDPYHQRQGFATKLLTYVLLFCKKQKISHCFLGASKEGASIYKKLGFRDLFIESIYTIDDKKGI